MTAPFGQLSTVHQGVAFEQRSLEVLQTHLSMSLRKVGGKSDGEIDLQGWWWLPPITRRSASLDESPAIWTGQDGEQRRRLRVLGQCKAKKKKMGPNYVREMEGVLGRHNSVPGRQPAVALLVSQSAFIRLTVLRAFPSPIPFFLLHLPPEKDELDTEEEQTAEIGVAIWNSALGAEAGLLGGEIARWERSIYHGGGRPGLWWNVGKIQDAVSGLTAFWHSGSGPYPGPVRLNSARSRLTDVFKVGWQWVFNL